MIKTLTLSTLSLISGYKIYQRILLSLAKKKGLVGHRKMAKFILSQIKKIDSSPHHLLGLDGADDCLINTRLNGLTKLVNSQRYKKSIEITEKSLQNYADSQLSTKTGIPFLFTALRDYLPPTPILHRGTNQHVYDIDGNEYIDFSNSLSNNFFGYTDQHEGLLDAIQSVESGAILSNYSEQTHKLTQKLKKFSNKELVSLHMSGTEAVMQACGLARYNTRKKKIVTFTGSYHGWWDGVQAGLGSTRSNKDSIMLEQESPRTMRALNSRNDVAAVLVNPLHYLFPNSSPPLDNATFGKRITPDTNESRFYEYQLWLQSLRKLCTQKNIALIFDEVYVGHRLGWGGAQKYFGIDADISIYGKSFGHGLPVGIVCSKERFGKRINDNYPFRIMLARGTFQGNPYVVGATLKALSYLEEKTNTGEFEKAQKFFKNIICIWNKAFEENQVPLSISHFESILTFNFLEENIYNWLFIYFLRDEGIYISTIPGLGRVPLPLCFSSEMADQALKRILKATERMKEDGFWGRQSKTPKKEIIKLCATPYLKQNA